MVNSEPLLGEAAIDAIEEQEILAIREESSLRASLNFREQIAHTTKSTIVMIVLSCTLSAIGVYYTGQHMADNFKTDSRVLLGIIESETVINKTTTIFQLQDETYLIGCETKVIWKTINFVIIGGTCQILLMLYVAYIKLLTNSSLGGFATRPLVAIWIMTITPFGLVPLDRTSAFCYRMSEDGLHLTDYRYEGPSVLGLLGVLSWPILFSFFWACSSVYYGVCCRRKGRGMTCRSYAYNGVIFTFFLVYIARIAVAWGGFVSNDVTTVIVQSLLVLNIGFFHYEIVRKNLITDLVEWTMIQAGWDVQTKRKTKILRFLRFFREPSPGDVPDDADPYA